MTIDKLKEILLPIGFECVSHAWVGDPEPTCYLFKMPNSPILENFMIYDFSRGKCYAYDKSWGPGGNTYSTNINEPLNYDLNAIAESYIKSYKEHTIENKIKELSADFV